MLAAVTYLVGIMLGLLVLTLVRRRTPDAASRGSGPTVLSCCALIFGLMAALAFAVSSLTGPSADFPVMGLIVVPVTAAFAAAVGIDAIRRGDHYWLTWLAPLPGVILGLAWIFLVVANVLGG